jgi:hypothetical protein
MKEKEVFSYLGFCFIMLFFTVPGICADWDDGMEIINDNFAISATPRHEWYPRYVYNERENEYMVTFRITGPLRDDCDEGDDYDCTNNFQGVFAQRVAPDGVLLGDIIEWVTPTTGRGSGTVLDLNPNTNEYMCVYSYGDDPEERRPLILRADKDGNIVYGPTPLYTGGAGASLLAEIAFNPVRRNYFVTYNDDDVFSEDKNNIGFILDENGVPTTTEPFPVGNQVGIFYAQDVVYNPDDDRYLVAWEDFRHATGFWAAGPNDIYGALIDGNGGMITEVPIMDDNDLPDFRTAWTPAVAYNPDKNEFFCAWTYDAPEVYDEGCIMGRTIAPDGTLGDPILLVDTPKSQATPEIIYVKEKKKYFMVYGDTIEYTPNPEDPPYILEYDMYATWLDDTGHPIGDLITLHKEEGKQSIPEVVYSPLMDSFLIAWRDENAPGDYPGIPDPTSSFSLYFDEPSDIMGIIYGVPSFLTTRVLEQGTEDPVEDAFALVIGPSLLEIKKTNVGGCFNVAKKSQPNGIYLAVVLKFGYLPIIQVVDYAGEPLKETIEMIKLW